MRKIRLNTRVTIASAAVFVAIVGGSVAGTVAFASGASSSADHPSTNMKLVEAIAKTDPPTGTAGAPTDLVPSSIRGTVLAEMNAVASCFDSHGFAAFPNTPSTFGDGSTPRPMIVAPPDPNSTEGLAFAAASSACQPENTALRTTYTTANATAGS